MFKKLLFSAIVLFAFMSGVSAEEWLYQKQYLTSHHSINYTGNVGRANLHILEDVSTASSNSAGDGKSVYAYCSDVDTGGYQGTYTRSRINDSDYNGNGALMRAILSSSYPFISMSEMKGLYEEQTGKSLSGFTYQEAITAVQAAIWSVSNPNHKPYSFGSNIDDSDMLKLTHNRIGLTCDWSKTNPSDEGYCYPTGTASYESNSSVAGARINAVIDWLLSLDSSVIDESGSVSVDVVSKEYTYDNSKDENTAKVSFKVTVDNLTLVDSLSSISVVVKDSNGNNVDVNYSDGVYSFTNVYPGNQDNISFDISVNYSSTYGADAYVFRSSGNQDLVTAYKDSFNKEASAHVDLENEDTKHGDVKISKVAVTGGAELPGAKLIIKDSTGKVIEEWISTDEIHEVKDLTEGTYTLTELLAPEGYATANTITFSIKDGEVTMVEMIDEVTKVIISKKDFTTEAEVVGARLVIKDSTGKVVHEWTSTNEPYYIEKLPVGKYTLIETVYPDGYEEGIIVDGILVSSYEFEVKDTGEIQKIDVYNRTTTITDVPKTGISSHSTLIGLSVILIGGAVIVYRRKLA